MSTFNPNDISAVSIGKLGTSTRFDALAREAESSADRAYWSDFGWESGNVPPPEYTAFVVGRRDAAKVLRQKADGLRRNGY